MDKNGNLLVKKKDEKERKSKEMESKVHWLQLFEVV
jgi:hypothetical protein